MKKKLLLFLSVSFLSLQSQTLTQSFNEPKVGDADAQYRLDTTAFTGSMPTSITGSISVWDFTKLALTNTLLTTNYLLPSSVPSASAYTGCSFVQQDGTFNTFMKSVSTPSAQTEILGATTSFGSLTFTNTGIAIRYPAGFGFSLTDNIAGSFSSTLASGSFSGSIVTSADGLGTLNLPGGLSLTNVLRLKSVQNINLSLGIVPLGTVKQTLYNYYHSSQKYPIISINYQTLSLISSGTPSVTFSIRGNANVLVSLNEMSAQADALFSVFPNPASGRVSVKLTGNIVASEIRIYNSMLQLMHKAPYTETIALEDFQRGLYFIELNTNRGILKKALLKE